MSGARLEGGFRLSNATTSPVGTHASLEPGANKTSRITLDQILATRSLAAGEAPQWSPDGSQIVFASSLGGAPDLWAISPNGGFPTRLTLGMGTVEFLGSYMPRWSPDGRYVSYVSAKSGADEVWLWPADGEPEFQLTGLGARIHSMSWAPDGRIALAGNRHGSYDIYLVEVPTGQTTRLSKDPLYEVNPVFTPDGAHILFVRLDDKWEDHEIVMMTADGRESTVIARDTDFFDYNYGHTFGYPLVSPNGSAGVPNGLISITKPPRHVKWLS